MWELIRRFSHDPSDPPSRAANSASMPRNPTSPLFPAPPPPPPPSSARFRAPSPFQPPPLDPVILSGYKPSTPRSARLLTLALAEEIRIMVPERLKLVEQWRMVYSLEQDGASLATLYNKVRGYEGKRVGFVLVIRDCEGATFGAYLSEYPRPCPSYYGNGECFLWRASVLASLPPPPSADTTHAVRTTTISSPIRSTFPNSSSSNTHHPPASSSGSSSSSSSPASSASASTSRPTSPDPFESLRFKAFPYSGENDYCINSEAGFLSLGAGGGHYGLWIDSALERGHSASCETFGNEPLSDEGTKFGILGLELWAVGA
ncbi:hypothetical protein TD95_005388 [Thielaviopsis punctulata]|uniref:Oxidation resistance protein 1 n=1 Tax=Thielaviopsis punctulata TaxID=72032 RepID=A0A0F4ZCE9_9PEZI|nr:hypothetical protein TD95_005388 [Thielaviopsis punctulata]